MSTTITGMSASSWFDSSQWLTLSCLAFATVFYLLKLFDGYKVRMRSLIASSSEL